MPLARNKLYTAEDYYNLPDNIRAELVDGYFIYNQAAPSRIHQEVSDRTEEVPQRNPEFP